MRRPWFKFYTGDWRADPGLRSCSFAARGLWIDILTIMHEATPYGHLLINGEKPSYYRIAQVIGSDRKQVKRMMLQLQNRGVFSVNSRGEMYSRRMVRDKLKSEAGQEFAKRRWGAGPNAPESRKKERGPTKESKGRKTRQAEQAWQRDLLHTEGPDGFAKVIDLLAANPALVDRATKAELRKPGSGVLAAVIGLTRLREVAS